MFPEFMKPILTELNKAYTNNCRYHCSWDKVFSDKIVSSMDKLEKIGPKAKNETEQRCLQIMKESIFRVDADTWMKAFEKCMDMENYRCF